MLFTTKREGLQSDKKVLNKIMLLIIFGVFLEISFAILSVIAEVSTLLMTAPGTLILLYVSGMLEILALLVIINIFASI